MRITLTLILIFCLALLGTAYYMEYALGLEPCPMCIIQRIAVALAALAALIGLIHNQDPKVYFGLTAFYSASGAASATRHLYLQSLPADQVPTCGPDLAYLIDKSYFADALRMLFIGDGNCAEVMWSLLGISIPGWVLICCIFILGFSIKSMFFSNFPFKIKMNENL